MQSRNFNNFQTRIRSQQLVGELNIHEEKSDTIHQMSNKISDMNVEIAKINGSLSALKKHSDQIQLEISTASQKDGDIEKIELELAKMSADLGVADAHLNRCTRRKRLC